MLKNNYTWYLLKVEHLLQNNDEKTQVAGDNQLYL